MVSVGRARFEELVADALDGLPPEIAAMLSNVVVLVEDSPPVGAGTLLGLYEGIPLTARDTSYAGVLPDRITLYRLTILGVCRSEAEVVEQVRTTVVHEIGHHVGLDEQRLHELGWG